MSALFETESTFELTGKGLFLLGQILEGEFKIGDYIHLNDEWREKILGIEFADGIDEHVENKFWVAILLGKLSKKKISEIKHMLLKENQLKISKNPN